MYDKLDNSKNHFTKSYDYVMLDTDERMTQQMKHVYCYLLRFKESNCQVFPSVRNIAQYTCFSEITVKRATRALTDIGLIAKQRRMDNSNIYTVNTYDCKLKPNVVTGNISISAGAGISETSAWYPTDTYTVSHRYVHGISETHYQINDEIKEKISLKEESQNLSLGCNILLEGMTVTEAIGDEFEKGQSQNNASLSQGDSMESSELLSEELLDEEEINCDKDSDRETSVTSHFADDEDLDFFARMDAHDKGKPFSFSTGRISLKPCKAKLQPLDDYEDDEYEY
ncbi:helix-turn-helix domain-containing protein [Escherichia coli]|uniref:helix-turn-helix domain-containing protein n=1 Tax=Escherichia coli TaxID=562 RepID=UPI0037DC4821